MQQPQLFSWYQVCATALNHMPHELTMRQWTILLHIYLQDGEHNVKSLAIEFGLPKPSVSRALSSLVQYGLIKRRKCQTDKRNITLQKTMKAIAFLNQFNDIVTKSNYIQLKSE